MKIVLPFPLLLFITSNLIGQKNKISEKDSPNAIFKCFTFQLNEDRIAEKKEFPYKEIIVVDERPDTTKCGYWLPNIENPLMKLCLKNGLKQDVSTFLNKYLNGNFNPFGNSVLACIKKCWTSTYDSSIIFYKTFFKIEFYIKKDSCYYPILRFDSTLFHKRVFKMQPSKIIEEVIIASIKKLSATNNNTTNLRNLSLNEIDSFNNQSQTIPAIKEKTARKGVYLNFFQFKNNQPAYTSFEISFDERADAIFVKGTNLKDSSITDSWGISDGENMYIRIKANYFPLFRIGYTFDLYGFDKITETRFYPGPPRSIYGNTTAGLIDVGIQGLLGLIKTKSKNLKPYQLDMDTGELY